MHFWFFSAASRLSRHVSAAVCLSRLPQTDGTGRLAIFTVPSVPSYFRETVPTYQMSSESENFLWTDGRTDGHLGVDLMICTCPDPIARIYEALAAGRCKRGSWFLNDSRTCTQIVHKLSLFVYYIITNSKKTQAKNNYLIN